MNDNDRPRILVVDDGPANIDVLVGILGRSYRVLVATTGRRALDIARRDPAPDIILLDVMIPGMNGYQVLAALRDDPATAHIPVIFVTALTDHADEFRGLSLGAVDYITKPVSAAVVEARVRTHLTLHHQRRELESKISQLEAAQARLVQAEKMASLSGLVAGIAHELNTPLGVVVGVATHLQSLVSELDGSSATNALTRARFQTILSDASEGAAILMANAYRAADLISGFKQVSADHASGARRNFLLKDYLDNLVRALKPKFDQGRVTVTVTCDETLRCDTYPGALAHLVTNLATNSLTHAFSGGEGHIRISAIQDGDQVVLEHADTGCGIAAEVIPHIFDPFFTTARGQGGTGLGLHIAFNAVVSGLAGTIVAASPPGKGAVFTIRFPRIHPPSTPQHEACP